MGECSVAEQELVQGSGEWCPGGHLCRDLMGITRHFLHIHQGWVWPHPHPMAVVLQPESSDPTHWHSVLETQPLVVGRDEIEGRVTNVTMVLWIPHDRQSSRSLRVLLYSWEDSAGNCHGMINGRWRMTLLGYIAALGMHDDGRVSAWSAASGFITVCFNGLKKAAALTYWNTYRFLWRWHLCGSCHTCEYEPLHPACCPPPPSNTPGHRTLSALTLPLMD